MDHKQVEKKMDTQNTIKTAAKTLDDSIAAILAAQASGDSKVLSAALRVGGIASVIVEKSTVIAANPEKYEKAQAESDMKVLPAIAATKDERAKAEGFLRFKSAHRAASQVRKVEALLTSMTSPAKSRGRKSRSAVTVTA